MSDGSDAALTVQTTNTGRKDRKRSLKRRSRTNRGLFFLPSSFEDIFSLTLLYQSLLSAGNDPWCAAFLENVTNASITSEADVSEFQA